MSTSSDSSDISLHTPVWTVGDALRFARKYERLDYHVVDYEVWFMIGEFMHVYDRHDFDQAMATRVDRREDRCEEQVLEVLAESCTDLTFEERGRDALRRYKAVFGYAASVFRWE